MAAKTIRIPVLVDDQGRWATCSQHSTPDAEVDWSFMSEQIDHETPPAMERQVWVTVTVELPEATEVTGTAEVGETKVGV